MQCCSPGTHQNSLTLHSKAADQNRAQNRKGRSWRAVWTGDTANPQSVNVYQLRRTTLVTTLSLGCSVSGLKHQGSWQSPTNTEMGEEGNCRQDRAALFQSGFAELERNSSTKWGRRQDGRPSLRLRVLDHQLARRIQELGNHQPN